MTFIKELRFSHLFVLVALFVLVFPGIGCLQLKTDGSFSQGNEQINRNEILENAKESGLIMDDEEILFMSQKATTLYDDKQIVLDAIEMEEMKLVAYAYQGALADVTGGGSHGVAKATFHDGVYKLFVSAGDLPELQEGMYFEGWIVKRGEEMKILSTGKLMAVDEGYINTYESNENLTGMSFYVVTSEWDDGDSTSGLHVLEGEMIK
ncbi:MAG: hypothetical protein UU08_C0008G0035 [Candidatus Uhrbacteria bacterium GW2011_GWE2_40_58]|nr:MAG: hypothetical protein UT94_C0008G0036 [Candidatus Uhrbacteria bacterium GW2011_GWF2_40_263]KKR67829.1 MAG: hypothetical protein UU08_C0008G0035 [Candidatus Uhrbacteria bacterium GW2011_GWE2_40_58]OGL94533.1 MAG: hypothetical protein A2239_00605 [Candidatus Uhrbacteria bacterium RIFOXYA2_FULL_40_9]OGL96784.1 MAG: hypothetical protein A2332_04580 [Candidatus Uhrbacteria bacterium RIFOXYB2_FULL_41_18]HBK34501.1 hypothetical protein [Candidatus Uhrbacteria bacterium]